MFPSPLVLSDDAGTGYVQRGTPLLCIRRLYVRRYKLDTLEYIACISNTGGCCKKKKKSGSRRIIKKK